MARQFFKDNPVKFQGPQSPQSSGTEDRVIEIKRVARTVKGGRRIRFRAVVISGDFHGKVGLGVGKGTEVSQAIAKATFFARKKMISVPLINETIPFEVKGHFGSADVLLKPNVPGSSIIAGGVVRTIAEVAGIRNLVAKILGGDNKLNNAEATLMAFKKLKKLIELRGLVEPLKKSQPKLIQTSKPHGKSKK